MPPHNIQAEQSLLGAMLLSRDAIASAVEACGTDDFYKPAHGHVFDAITSLYGQGEPADPVTVADELSRAGLLDGVGGLPTLISLQADTPATANAGRYATIVEEHALLRRLIGVAGEIAELGYSVPEDVEAVVDRAETLVFEVAERRTTDTLKPLNKLLEDSLDRLEALYERGEAVTGVPTGFVDLDEQLSGLQKSALIIVGARPAMGKCVAWDTRIADPATGSLRRIEDLVRQGRSGGTTTVLTSTEGRRLTPAPVGARVDDGIRPVFRVRTRLGRQIRTTASHPFLTPEGWRCLADLAVGARVGVPRRLPLSGSERTSDAELTLLAYLVSEAGRGSGQGELPAMPCLLADAARSAAALGLRVVCGAGGTGHRLDLGQSDADASPSLLQSEGVRVCRSADHRIPDRVFRLANDQVALFLNRLFATDGGAVRGDAGDGRPCISFTTAARPLAADVAHLLLRFGVCARVRPCSLPYRRSRRQAWAVEVTGPDIERFCVSIGIFSEVEACARLRSGGGRPAGGGEGSADHSRDLCWDEIVAIVADGEDRVYDLTVPGTHNFVADDMVVHNTAFALGIAAHAAMEAHEPVLVFSLEMSHAEITQRLLVAEARVDANRIRNGRLQDSDWPKISNAIGRLGEAPLFIDDNPNLTVMELRAKARRLKSKEGGLGLIVVDYLQLMSGRRNAESRQVEISEISRGLKILARELEVPVLALSQLSRNLEMRADKRPVLADLRESGSLEQDADVVMFLYRDEVYNSESADRGTAEIIVSKHRNGPTGKAQLAFVDHYTRFANMARV